MPTLASTNATFVGAKVKFSAYTLNTGGSGANIPWDQEDFDTDGFHDNVTNNTRLTVPTGKAGKYQVNAAWSLGATSATAARLTASITVNGAAARGGKVELVVPAATAQDALNVSGLLDLAVGDYVELFAFQTSGANKALDTAESFLSMYRVG